ncbi:CDP-alcohol phosphatidyltransferase family protein [Indioceanicola profundi]|uniref:CDP-alcohol phosphatidyltransferase family protein n=1 Tax=Indioceanicola profundi TaxID=2220096 RepID=UPI000E6AA991|nr:CDP-alcohol phosphatidyltransferase family protein [Indioceanicola profundi]
MLDASLRRLIDPPLNSAGVRLGRLGMPATAVTLAGFAVGVASFPFLAAQMYGWALLCIGLNRLADGLDGAIARARGPTDLGGYLDITLDFLFYAGVPVAFAFGRPEFALHAAVLVFSFVGTMASFLAFAIIAAKRGITTAERGAKAIYYLGGLAEGTETIIFLALACLLPDLFGWLAGVFAAMCWITTGSRIAQAVLTFRDE